MQKIAIGFNKAGNFLHTLLPLLPLFGDLMPHIKRTFRVSFFLRMQFKTKFSSGVFRIFCAGGSNKVYITHSLSNFPKVLNFWKVDDRLRLFVLVTSGLPT